MKHLTLFLIWVFLALSIALVAESCRTVSSGLSEGKAVKTYAATHKTHKELLEKRDKTKRPDSLSFDELDSMTVSVDSDSVAIQLADSLALDSLRRDTLERIPLPLRLASILNRLEKDYSTTEIGFSAYDLTADSLLYGYQDRKLYRPASTQKIFTAISALEQLGLDYKFQTRVYRTGAIVKGSLQGDLYVVGGLDSEFDDSDMNELADAVKAQGIERIEGRLIGDVSMKDSLYWGSGWAWDDTPEDFQPYLSPLMFSKGYVAVKAIPGRKGRPANLRMYPESPFYQVVNQTVSRPSGSNGYRLTRNWIGGGNRLVATGNVTSTATHTVNIIHSSEFFMSTLQDRLSRRGIEVDTCLFGEYSGDGDPVISISHSLDQVLRRALKKSDNLSAEAMFYNLGAKRSGKKYIGTKESVGAVSAQMTKARLNPHDYRVADGSGISMYNYTSAWAEVQMLRYQYKQPTYGVFYSALPIAGIDGTLRNRMKGTPAYNNVHAKTGTVTGISSLAGYVTTASGHTVAFSIICTGVIRARIGRIIQDKLCVVMSE